MPPKYSRNLLVAAHPDDEVIGAGAWAVAQTGELAVAFLTDGVPGDRRYYAPGFNDPDEYRRARRQEAVAVWRQLRPQTRLYCNGIADQDLAFQLPAAARWLGRVISQEHPQLILVPAFEAGHPDHDAANFLVAQLAHSSGIAAWEYALYTPWQGEVRHQCFPPLPAPRLSAAASERKRAALAGYISQSATLQNFDPAAEAMRPLPAHDYTRPARPEPAVYERWGWPIRPAQVAAQFRTLLCAC